MNKHLLIIAVAFLLLFSSCQAKPEKQKRWLIEQSISDIKTEMTIADITNKNDVNSTEQQKNKSESFVEILKEKLPQKSPGDSIIGVWEVKNEYYKAIYEIVKHDGQYFGKVHYYNDGTSEIKAQNNENDYFLDNLQYKDGKYSTATIYTPDGKILKVNFKLKGDKLNAEMTINGHPYTETWKRKKLEPTIAKYDESK